MAPNDKQQENILPKLVYDKSQRFKPIKVYFSGVEKEQPVRASRAVSVGLRAAGKVGNVDTACVGTLPTSYHYLPPDVSPANHEAVCISLKLAF